MLYQQVVLSREQAYCHLLLYFSLFEDETFKGEETYQVFSILKLYPVTAKVNFAEEVILFFEYKASIKDIKTYFTYLVRLVATEEKLPIFFNATQVALSDRIFSDEDQIALDVLGDVLGITTTQRDVIADLAMSERKLKIKESF